MINKKTPTRKCIGCNESFPKKELLRIVRSPEGDVSIDPSGKKSGRGAYICKSTACFRKAYKANRLAHSLEAEIPSELIKQLESEIAQLEAEKSSAEN